MESTDVGPLTGPPSPLGFAVAADITGAHVALRTLGRASFVAWPRSAIASLSGASWMIGRVS